jgi:hypothetical protein
VPKSHPFHRLSQSITVGNLTLLPQTVVCAFVTRRGPPLLSTSYIKQVVTRSESQLEDMQKLYERSVAQRSHKAKCVRRH